MKYTSDGESEALAAPFGYTGQLYLPELQLYYYKARMYSPKAGRFLQPDPIGYEGGMNLYGYVGGDPVNGRDPFGLQEADLNECHANTMGMCAPVAAGVEELFVFGRQRCDYSCQLWEDFNRYIRDAAAAGQSAQVNPTGGPQGGPPDPYSFCSDTHCFRDAPITNPDLEAWLLLPLRPVRLMTAARGALSAVQLGRAGEAAVRAAVNIGPATRITVNGASRIPDGLTARSLSEVKNVGSLSYTQQLRDFATFAQQTGRQFDLYVRTNTQLSGPLLEAINAGQINLRYIPGL